MAKTLVYQLYPLAWPDGLKGMTQHLSRISKLGADYVWLSPVYSSPLQDHGYDVSDYQAINAKFGTMKDFDAFVSRAHSFGIKVLMDLVINHTSTQHLWFRQKPEYYCWQSSRRKAKNTPPYPGWHNLFNGGSAWAYDQQMNAYYLHLFHRKQADLNWFPGGRLNRALVREFRQIVDFWTHGHRVDGFRLDAPQCINKDFGCETLELENLLIGDKAADVIDAIFPGVDTPFLIMECLDPTFGELTEFYASYTPIDFVCNICLKDTVSQNQAKLDNLVSLIEQQARDSHYMLELESHDSPRFPSRGIKPVDMIWSMFNSAAEGICLYQGQELGLTNPTSKELPDSLMYSLDAQTAMRYIMGEDLDKLRLVSRANARIPLPLDEYKLQEQTPGSYLNLTKEWIQRWRNG